MATLTEETWTVDLPSGWEAQRDDVCVTLYHRDGVGALQISAAFKGAPVTDEDLRDFAQEHLDAGAKTVDVVAGDFCGFVFAFGTADTYWRHWYLRSADQILFATYNCRPNDRGAEDNDVLRILSSLRDRRCIA